MADGLRGLPWRQSFDRRVLRGRLDSRPRWLDAAHAVPVHVLTRTESALRLPENAEGGSRTLTFAGLSRACLPIAPLRLEQRWGREKLAALRTVSSSVP